MATLRQDLGPVTAYAYAVSEGYTGTEEEFAEVLANFADSAEQVAADAAQVALDKGAVHDDKEAVDSAEGRVTSAVNTFTTTTAPNAVTAVENAGAAQIGLVEAEGTRQIGLVADKGTEQVGTVSSEGTTQIGLVEAKGAEVIASIPGDYSTLQGDIASTYSSSSTYAVGDYVLYSGQLYRCTTAISTAEAWTSAKWTAVALGDDVSTLKSALNNYGEKITGGQISKTSTASTDTVFTALKDLDDNYKTYSSYLFNNSGGISANSSYDTWAFKCPCDNLAIKTSAFRLCIANSYPDTTAGTVSIRTMLINNNGSYQNITIPNKGDIVVLSLSKSYPLYMITNIPIPAQINNLFLTKDNDRFLQNIKMDAGISHFGNDLLNITKITGVLINSSTGGYSSNSSYNTYYFRVIVPVLTIKCTNGFRACISYKEPSETSNGDNLKTLLYANSSALVETFTAVYGDWVVISVGASQEIALSTDFTNRFDMPTLRLGYLQSDSFFKYEEFTYSSGPQKYLYIFYKSGNKYVGWELHNLPNPNINSDTWQLGHVMGLDESLANSVELVGNGEFELAFKEYGAADFCGGNNHGDETTIDFTLTVDGKVINNLATLNDGKYHAFNRIDVVEHAMINRCDTPDEDILKHQKMWTFEKGTVKVRQSLEFLETIQGGFLCCMLAAKRSYFTHGVRQGRVGTEVMTTSIFPDVSTDGNEMAYLMYGEHATAKVTARTCEHTPVASLWINPAESANKLYYDFYSRIPTTSTAEGTVLWWESEYDIGYN